MFCNFVEFCTVIYGISFFHKAMWLVWVKSIVQFVETPQRGCLEEHQKKAAGISLLPCLQPSKSIWSYMSLLVSIQHGWVLEQPGTVEVACGRGIGAGWLLMSLLTQNIPWFSDILGMRPANTSRAPMNNRPGSNWAFYSSAVRPTWFICNRTPKINIK